MRAKPITKMILSIIDDNENKTIGLNLRHDFLFKTMRFSALANYEQNKYISPLLKNRNQTKHFFLSSAIASTKMIDSTFEPKLFAKYLDCFGEKVYWLWRTCCFLT